MPTRPVDATIPRARTPAFLFRGQVMHAALLALLVVVARALAAPMGDGSWLGLGVDEWFWLNILVAAVHQTVVAVVFRVQLGWGLLTRVFGRFDLVAWGAVFMPFLIARPLVIGGLAAADAGSLALPRWLAVAVGAILLLPALCSMTSIVRYFGIPRALGGDHFRLEYRAMPLVREGAFAWTPNAMYLIVFLGLWAVALLAGSRVALVGALFQHAYIWVHYVFTEKPDMDLMYGSG